MPITPQQFEDIKQEAEQLILCHVERKNALLMAQKLEEEADEIKNSEPEIYDELQKIIAKLKWIASPIIRDSQKFYDLVKNHLLEGLEIPELLEIVLTRLGFQMGYELQESLNIVLSAMRQNFQTIGNQAIMVAAEQKPAKPTIQNWLTDFIRSSSSQTLTEVDETNYLFNNQNARALSNEDKKILRNLFSLYSSLRFVSQEVARQAIYETRSVRNDISNGARQTEPQPLVAQNRQAGESDFYEEGSPDTPTPQVPERKYSPPPALQPVSPSQGGPSRKDVFREQVSDEDLAGPQAIPRPAPKIEGNVVNLKDFSKQ